MIEDVAWLIARVRVLAAQLAALSARQKIVP